MKRFLVLVALLGMLVGCTKAKSEPVFYAPEFLQSANYTWALMTDGGPVLKTDLTAAFAKLESKQNRTFDEDMLLLEMKAARLEMQSGTFVSDSRQSCDIQLMLKGKDATSAKKYCGTWVAN
jgi:hypothetical protein